MLLPPHFGGGGLPAWPDCEQADPVMAHLVRTGVVGLGYFGSQAEINQLAPPERRGEVTAAFITCLYTGVSITVISVGVVSDAVSLRTAVTAASIAIAAVALATTVWHLAGTR